MKFVTGEVSEQFDRLVAWLCGDALSRSTHSSLESMVVLWAVSSNQGRGNRLAGFCDAGRMGGEEFFYIYLLFIYLTWVFLAAHGIPCCGAWTLQL